MIAVGASTRRWAFFCAVAALAIAAALRQTTVLEVENDSRGSASLVPLPEGAPFSVTSRHSMYDAAVTEEFVVDREGRIALRSVSSPSAAVREYFGITALGERHAIERAMERIIFRVAMGAPQRLVVGGRERSFLEFGDRGDRLVMRAVHRPALARWLRGS